MKIRKRTDFIVVHCSATPEDRDIGAAEIRKWHLDKGWADIGYHEVIRRDGTTEYGRDIMAVGAHVEGYNNRSIGICMVGGVNDNGEPENNFTPEQWDTLKKRVKFNTKIFPNAIVQGHRDFPNVNKACPCFNAIEWWDMVEKGRL